MLVISIHLGSLDTQCSIKCQMWQVRRSGSVRHSLQGQRCVWSHSLPFWGYGLNHVRYKDVTPRTWASLVWKQKRCTARSNLHAHLWELLIQKSVWLDPHLELYYKAPLPINSHSRKGGSPWHPLGKIQYLSSPCPGGKEDRDIWDNTIACRIQAS